jgi:serine/threonine protein kinase
MARADGIHLYGAYQNADHKINADTIEAQNTTLLTSDGDDLHVVKIKDYGVRTKYLLKPGAGVTLNAHTRRFRPTQQQAADPELENEFRTFEKIYESETYYERFGGGRPIHDLEHHEIHDLQNESRRIEQHPGHAHIHEYKHYVVDLPAIIMEYCDGNVDSLANEQPALFTVPANRVDLTATLKDVILHIGSAIEFMRSRGYIHGNINPFTVLYQRGTRGFMQFKLSDFKTVLEDKPTAVGFARGAFFAPPFPNTTQPINAAMYAFACTVAWLLRFDGLPWPYDHMTHITMTQRINELHRTHPDVAELYFPDARDRMPESYDQNVVWTLLTTILNHDYGEQPSRPRFDLMQWLMRKIRGSDTRVPALSLRRDGEGGWTRLPTPTTPREVRTRPTNTHAGQDMYDDYVFAEARHNKPSITATDSWARKKAWSESDTLQQPQTKQQRAPRRPPSSMRPSTATTMMPRPTTTIEPEEEPIAGSFAQPIFPRTATQTSFYPQQDDPTLVGNSRHPWSYLTDQYSSNLASAAQGRLAGALAQPPDRLQELLDAAIQIEDEEEAAPLQRQTSFAKKTATRRF